ncbi:MAG TPA: IS110 family transposase, partial [Thermoanaerobaculia bacterium]|nr:IS110 family transposase [Thermoanaerobaculia bacterium]
RIKARDGWAAAIKASAHKLAVIFYSMMKTKTPYREAGVDYYEKRYQQKLFNSLEKKALTLGYQLTPLPQ